MNPPGWLEAPTGHERSSRWDALRGGAFSLTFTFVGQGEELLLPSLSRTAWVIKALPRPGCNDGVGGTPFGLAEQRHSTRNNQHQGDTCRWPKGWLCWAPATLLTALAKESTTRTDQPSAAVKGLPKARELTRPETCLFPGPHTALPQGRASAPLHVLLEAAVSLWGTYSLNRQRSRHHNGFMIPRIKRRCFIIMEGMLC